MWRFDIFLDNLLPPSSTEPSPKEALNFFNFLQFGRVLCGIAEGSEIWYVVEIIDQLLLLLDGVTCCGAYTTPTWCRWKWWTRRFLAKYTNLLSTYFVSKAWKDSILTLVSRHREEKRWVGKLINLSTKFSNLRRKLFTLLTILPLRCLFTLDDLQQMNMLLLEFFFLQQQLVKTFIPATHGVDCDDDEMSWQQQRSETRSWGLFTQVCRKL